MLASDCANARFDDTVGYALRFLSLTAVRPGEIASAEWADIDIKGARWTIPAAKMKMDKEHVVPLSRQAVDILRKVKELTGKGRFVFSCGRDAPILDNTLNKRLRILGIDTAVTHCSHGFRSTFSTLMSAECDQDEVKLWDSDVIELQLAHLDESTVKAIYNRTGPTSLIGARGRLTAGW